jgi:hypothetical protein
VLRQYLWQSSVEFARYIDERLSFLYSSLMNDVTLYLTKEEVDNVFTKLPAKAQSSWKPRLTVESLTTFETEDELQRRMSSVRTDDIPGIKEFVESFITMVQKKDLTNLSLNDVPEVAILRHFYAIGACGMSALIEVALQDPELDDDAVFAIADFSVIRHAILQANASASA